MKQSLLEAVPRNARLREVIALIESEKLGTVSFDHEEIIIQLNARADKPRFRYSKGKVDAGLVLVSAVRKALKGRR